MKYVHSSSVGCHYNNTLVSTPGREHLDSITCISRFAPGSTVTSATAIFFATLKLRESAILTDPPSSISSWLHVGEVEGVGLGRSSVGTRD